MKKVIIIGGGIAGFSSALYLSNKGYKVELIEATNKFGGRINSFNYKGINVDNGQHILAECYSETLELLKLIGAENNFTFQKTLTALYIDKNKKSYQLKSSPYFYPLNNIVGFLRFDLLSFAERLSVLKLLFKIKYIDARKINDKNVYEFLYQAGQTEESIRKFWEGLVVSTMNTSTKEASTVLFIDMMKILFSTGTSSNLIIPDVGWSEALINPLLIKLKENNVILKVSEKMNNFNISNNRITRINTNKREIKNFDLVIFAVPEKNLRKLNLINKIGIIPKFKYSPIVTVHILLSRNPFERRMYNLVDSEFDWMFNNGTHISLVKSNAKKLATINKNMVIKIAFSELKKYFTILNNIEFKDYIVLKEKNATIISNLDSVKERKSISIIPENLFLVGDWTNTGLPATIEGAIKSSKNVIHKINLLNFN